MADDERRDRAGELQDAQRAGSLGDMSVADFRRAAHRVADMVADYLERLEDYPVLPAL